MAKIDQLPLAAERIALSPPANLDLLDAVPDEPWQAKAPGYVLILTLALSGGVERHVRERCLQLRRTGFLPLIVKPDSAGQGKHLLAFDNTAHEELGFAQTDLSKLQALLSKLSIDHVELHHFLDLDPKFVEAVLGAGWPYDIYIHDFSWYCPRITLLNGELRYCGEPEASICQACIDEHGSEFAQDIPVVDLRARSERWLSNARRIVVPSNDTAARLTRQFPGLSPAVERWEAQVDYKPRKTAPPAGRTRVLVLGAIGSSKGFDVILACAEDAAARDLPLEFRLVGHSEDDEKLVGTGRVFVTGRYQDSDAQELIAREKASVAFFSSVWPETWSYTLTHALRAGLPICAFDIGAIAERLQTEAGGGHLLPLDSNAELINDRLLEISRGGSQPSAPSVDRQKEPSRSVEDISVPKGTLTQRTPSRMQTPEPISASVQTLTLDRGLYLFSVRSASPSRIGLDSKIILPAVQVTICPGTPPGAVEFIEGPQSHGPWLFGRDHLLVVKVHHASAIVLVTSVRAAGLAALDIDVQKLGTSNGASAPENAILVGRGFEDQPQDLAAPEAGAGGSDGMLRLQVVAHVRNRGDLPFPDGRWAGCVGEGLWIESYSIVPLEKLTPNDIEYKGLTSSGVETPWISGGAPCGTRGKSVPLVGFAVRVKPQASGKVYDCTYRASFLSGATTAPAMNGQPCVSDAPDDAIEAIHVSIAAPAMDEPADTTRSATFDKSGNNGRPPVGPRFSIFRESSNV